MSFDILQATQSWVQHVKADGNSHTRKLLITMQIQHFAENYGKQTLKGI